MEHLLEEDGGATRHELEDLEDDAGEARLQELWGDEQPLPPAYKMSFSLAISSWQPVLAPGPVLALVISSFFLFVVLSANTLIRVDAESLGGLRTGMPIEEELMDEFGGEASNRRGPGILTLIGIPTMIISGAVFLFSFGTYCSRLIQQAASHARTYEISSDFAPAEALNDWVFFLGAAAFACLPGLAAALLLQNSTTSPLIWSLPLVTLSLLFPLLMISALENGKPLQIYDPGIFRSVVKDTASWLPLILVMLSASGLSVAGLALHAFDNHWLNLLLAPLAVAAGFVYAVTIGITAHVVVNRILAGAANGIDGEPAESPGDQVQAS